MYESISGQLLSTYHQAFMRSLLSSLTIFFAPKGWTRCENTDKPTPISSYHPSLFLSSGLHLVWIPRRYIEQNVKHSTDKYPAAIDPSGCVLFLTNRFSLPINLSIWYIQRNWTGPANSSEVNEQLDVPLHQKKQAEKSFPICIGSQQCHVSFDSRHLISKFVNTIP